jgi:hypothetical protein
MSGVAAAIRADDHAGRAGEGIGDFSLPLVSPLSSENDRSWHRLPIVW